MNCEFCRDKENILPACEGQWEGAEIRLFAWIHALLGFIILAPNLKSNFPVGAFLRKLRAI